MAVPALSAVDVLLVLVVVVLLLMVHAHVPNVATQGRAPASPAVRDRAGNGWGGVLLAGVQRCS